MELNEPGRGEMPQIRWFYHIARIAVRMALFFSTSCTLEGMKNIPKNGAYLIVSNHLSLADPPLVSVSITRETVFMAKEQLFGNWFTNYFIRSFGAFPVRRGTIDRHALRDADSVLRAGKVLVMFPEATRSANASLQEAYPGAAMIALRNNASIIPVAVTGTEKMAGWSWLLRRPKVKLTVGQPFALPETNGKITREQISQGTRTIMEHIAELLPPSYRGVYATAEATG